MADEDSGRLNRRSVLAGIGAAGAGAALGGFGTSALFTDEEHLDDNEIVAGELDLFIDWQEKYDKGDGLKLIDVFPADEKGGKEQADLEIDDFCKTFGELGPPLHSKRRSVIDYDTREPTKGNKADEPLVYLDDVKPGDRWETTFSYHLCGNDGWVWFRTKNKEYLDAHGEDKPEDHLADKAHARVWYDMYEGPDGDAASVTGDITEDTTEIDEIFSTLTDSRFPEPGARNFDCDDYEERLGRFEEGDLAGDELFEGDFEESDSAEGECGTVTVDERTGGTVTFSSDGPVLIVSVKGGNEGENVYVFQEPVILDGATFSTPTGQDISNIDVCCAANGEEIIEPGDNVYQEGKEPLIAEGTLREVLDELNDGVLLDADPDIGSMYNDDSDPACTEASTTRYIGFEWWLPMDVGNEIQQDRLEFDLGFYTEQCRHNPNPQNPFVDEPDRIDLPPNADPEAELEEQFNILSDIDFDTNAVEICVEQPEADGETDIGVQVTDHHGTFDETPTTWNPGSSFLASRTIEFEDGVGCFKMGNPGVDDVLLTLLPFDGGLETVDDIDNIAVAVEGEEPASMNIRGVDVAQSEMTAEASTGFEDHESDR
ncbi:SipW-dependent-type signal peptide-containing protein [Natranaeroarchaeum aerophilus]|uniref:SipW-dependent-type signal peptide-containing protein n=1 Tax=Natranaeroarchaeum aerophilus TaxID=2917711 RepID=A0AAE3FNK7_9EURY|nr:SipW-dependent-type signal peptide-containing protein [Natranaeroarchaeum aerophilus]MCL9812747.1 SipW-dependent-type signal peptide-containing protein [Natranaeroarchaeum aerophilus]